MNIDDIIGSLDEPTQAQMGSVAERQQSCKVADRSADLVGLNQSQPPAFRMSVSNMLKLDTTDQSLERYKKALLGEVAECSEDRECEVEFLGCEIVALGRPGGPIKIQLGSKENRIQLKQGCEYHLRLTFMVRYDIVVNLKLINNVYKGPIKLASSSEPLGSFAPLAKPHVVDTDDQLAPEGFMGRGEYKGKVVVIDGEGTAHLQYEYQLKVDKDW